MYRKIMMLIVGIAFAVPLAPAQTLFARPLATPVEPVEWCWGDCGGDDEEPPDVDLCYEEMTGSDSEDHRCDFVLGRACREMCTASAVAASCALELGRSAGPRALARCGAERLDLCRYQCDTGGAGFCEVRKKDPPAWGHCKESKPGEGSGHSGKGELNDTHEELDTRPECQDKPGGGPSRPTPEEQPEPDEGPSQPTPEEEPEPDDGVIYVDVDVCWEAVVDPIPG